MYVCVEVRISPLSVARAPHYVKEAELDHSHFLKVSGIWKVGGVKYLGYSMALKMFYKGSMRISCYCLAFCLLTTALLL